MDGTQDLQIQIARLELKPGDVLVISPTRQFTAEQAARCRNHVGTILNSSNRVMILDPGMDLTVLTREEIDART
ncbi:MAG: hypothetical protein JWO51_148 [Rhodospirillales bacterium]|nr:hypothetical protein [Rhodospirillales bacterium]